MCGRYFISETGNSEIASIVAGLKRKDPSFSISTGEVCPGTFAPVFVLQEGKARSIVAKWGFSLQNGRILVNARAETAQIKTAFSSAFQNFRCVVPANGFYEWNKEKKKYYFTSQKETVLWLGGLAQKGTEGISFCILTMPANSSVCDIHPRMPLILSQEEVRLWLQDIRFAMKKVNSEMPLLSRAEM